MKFGDKVIIKDGSSLEGSIGVIYRLEAGKAVVLLDKEALWPVEQDKLELLNKI